MLKVALDLISDNDLSEPAVCSHQRTTDAIDFS